jgi:cysteine desulfurase / selenocysteine lyase
VNPVKQMIARAHAQAVPHMPVDVQDLDCDFYAFSGHKLFGPTGIGVLYGKMQWLDAMPPYQGGGSMISTVSFEKTTYAAVPQKFEAGTPDIAGAIGLGAAVDYVEGVGLEAISRYEHELLVHATEVLSAVPGLTIIGQAEDRASVVSFVLADVHPHDIGTIVDQNGVAIRAGHHCAQPLMVRCGIAATARASFAFYNTKEEINILARALDDVIEVFS